MRGAADGISVSVSKISRSLDRCPQGFWVDDCLVRYATKEETARAMAAKVQVVPSHARPVEQWHKTQEAMLCPFPSAADAATSTCKLEEKEPTKQLVNSRAAKILECLDGRRKSAFGYRWRAGK